MVWEIDQSTDLCLVKSFIAMHTIRNRNRIIWKKVKNVLHYEEFFTHSMLQWLWIKRAKERMILSKYYAWQAPFTISSLVNFGIINTHRKKFVRPHSTSYWSECSLCPIDIDDDAVLAAVSVIVTLTKNEQTRNRNRTLQNLTYAYCFYEILLKEICSHSFFYRFYDSNTYGFMAHHA